MSDPAVNEVVLIGQRIGHINTAINELGVAYGNFKGGKSGMYDGKLFRALSSEREGLRLRMLDIEKRL